MIIWQTIIICITVIVIACILCYFQYLSELKFYNNCKRICRIIMKMQVGDTWELDTDSSKLFKQTNCSETIIIKRISENELLNGNKNDK